MISPRKKSPSPKRVKASALKAETRKAPDANKPSAADNFFVVGMGGSAGSLDSFEQFFKALPSGCSAAFIIVPHLDPTHKGVMPELIQRHTAMKVTEATEGVRVRPGCVYIIPPNRNLAILHGRLQLFEPSEPRGMRLPIDFFLGQLADDMRERAVGIILSGMGSDGTLGLRAIKEQKGMAMAQAPDTAQYDSMPQSAIDTGLVDYIAAPDELALRLAGYIKGAAATHADAGDIADKKISGALQKVFILLRSHTGSDFSHYKKNTIMRRIERRLNVHHIATIEEYVRYLQDNSAELDILFSELLIGVTNFFRDRDAFRYLEEGHTGACKTARTEPDAAHMGCGLCHR